MKWACSHKDLGKAAAAAFLNWVQGGLALVDLPLQLQDLAIITHLAEVGRGYSAALSDQLYPWLQAVVEGNMSWWDYRVYWPSLTSKEDSLQDWGS